MSAIGEGAFRMYLESGYHFGVGYPRLSLDDKETLTLSDSFDTLSFSVSFMLASFLLLKWLVFARPSHGSAAFFDLAPVTRR